MLHNARASNPMLRLLFLLACLTLAGCEEELATQHGIRGTTQEGLSVNGTAVLANMFEQAGHEVYTRRALSKTLAARATTIVWFPDTFEPPSEENIEWFNEWLTDHPERTLIFVGRDFDSAPSYWDAIIPGTSAAKAPEYRRRLNDARLDRANNRGKPDDEECEWFNFDYSPANRIVTTLSGPWAAGVNPKKAKIELEGRIDPHPADTTETLLESQGDRLAWRFHPVEEGGRIIVVANGSFLMNYPLVNHEHRKLAAQLVADVDPQGRVVFVESDQGGLPISEDPDYKLPSALAMFTVWPINVLLLHLAALGVVLCVCWWPIFGRPLARPRSEASDFSKHIDALGEMLELTGDHSYATIRVLQYQQSQRGEAVPPSAFRGPTAAPPVGQVTTGQNSGASPDAEGTRSADHAAARRGTPPAREQL
ncbi:MAG: hypothetical protein K8T91_19630 [Planctomycetes bacterium]|nr:hypothetical protein [Planctomycetota bacterium]